MHKYRLVAKKGEGTFSEVLKAQCIKNSKYVAIKCMKNHFDSLEQVNNLREIQALRRLSPHPNIVKLLEVLYDQPTGRLALVFELMDMNIYELIRGRRHYIGEERVKHYMWQLMKAMDHMHRHGIFHRDIKPENILIMDDCLKLADFGSCRGIYSAPPYTEYISTRWYRAPECLLTDGFYTYKMDMWGVGCVFFEIVSLFPLFPGTNELDQVHKIHNIVGTPPPDLLDKMRKLGSHHLDLDFPPKEGSGIEKLIPHAPPECVELICKLLAYNPDDRLSAKQALRHPYFRDIREKEKHDKPGHDAGLSSQTSPRFPGPEDALPEARRKGPKDAAKSGRASQMGDGAAANTTALPSIGKGREDDKENEAGPSQRLPEEASQASSLPSMHSTGHAYGAGASHRGTDGREEGRSGEEAVGAGGKGLPPIRNSYTLASLPTKSGKGAHYNTGQQRAERQSQLKGTKLGKGGTAKATGLPPDKVARISEAPHPAKTGAATQRKGDHLKYVSPYSQKYIATQRTSGNYVS